MENQEYLESTSITFEWTLRDVKALLESSKGEAKSKVTKSMKFGGGRWQILFYANAGTEGGHISIYLSSEPTLEEKDRTLDGKWVRDGIYKFSFELRSADKAILYNAKEAHSHTFSYKTANWGWAQFARRDVISNQSNAMRQQDALIISCTIASSPAPATPVPPIPRQKVPKTLLDTVGSLLDDPACTDIEFVIPKRGGSLKSAKRILASRSMLKRVDYFDTMFSSGFAESTMPPPALDSRSQSRAGFNDGMSDSRLDFEDSDNDDESLAEDEMDIVFDPVETTRASTPSESSNATLAMPDESTPSAFPAELPLEEHSDAADDSTSSRNVRSKLRHPSSPRSTRSPILDRASTWNRRSDGGSGAYQGPPKQTIIVRDFSYSTYRAALYYIYTDSIIFAPLTSSFIASAHAEGTTGDPSSSPPATAQNPGDSQMNSGKSSQPSDEVPAAAAAPTTRKGWIQQWQKNHPGRPAPCSAKAIYRLADRLDLRELKERASGHIIKSLTAENISYEVFSPFSAAFEDIRKIQVSFFLKHWAEIRTSNAMHNVWQQIRIGRHPGFEEVWPYIARHLEFKPTAG
ncbi:hypothetical protein PLICRDRAFT_47435 [Plicaturopsis crispa FD-325 SS-3]|uniref:MATH domain-containing protein n=1 Tax=Plicaturopsis crispa FD-325 SS-3 TaxID=944288 RepID=A0A0C9SPV3_PLICR|nr:hypothetical protein PLICRDRAFT_47435 [Plicaturopsis crispa FD-325 SS-3]